MMGELVVSANGETVGHMSVRHGQWRFRYAPNWNAFPLSPHFPLGAREFEDDTESRRVEWFFDNLLPEGRLRELIAFRERIDPRDTWAFLVRHGQDTASAFSFAPAGQAFDSHERLLPLTHEALRDKLVESRARNLPLLALWEAIRMSLAGAQEKLGLRIEPSGALFLPEGAAASTHIVKPDNAGADFPFYPANEFFCMRLAGLLKLPVPAVDLLHLPEPLYAVRRFDRDVAAEHVTRLHQIDLCQAMGVAASKKYESEGGLGLHDLFGILSPAFIERPVVAVKAVIHWVCLNYLIGNLDAHAKNIAFLLRGTRATVAPFYDLLCVEAYLPRQPLSMGIAGENKPGWVEGHHWDALAFEAGVAPRFVRDTLAKMSAALPEATERSLADERITALEREFLRERVLPVIEERRSFVADALRARPAPLSELVTRTDLDPTVRDRLARLPTR